MFACVTIVPDLTKTQRKGEMRLREEAERRNQDLTEEERERNLKWIVAGSRGEKRIIKGTERDKNSGQGGGSGGSCLGGEGVLEGEGGGDVTPPQTDTSNWRPTDQQTNSNSNSNAFNSYSNINSNRTNPSFNFIPRQNKAGPSNSSGSGSASNSNQGYNNSNTNYGRGDYGNNRYGNNSGDNLSSN